MNVEMKKKIKRIIHFLFSDNEYTYNCLINMRINKLQGTMLSQKQVENVENGLMDKEVVVAKCVNKWPRITSVTQKEIDRLFQKAEAFSGLSREKKSQIRTDILFCRFAYGFIPDEFICYRLDLKNTAERHTFISEIDHLRFYYLMNDIFEADIFNDKMRTYSFYSKYYGREIVSISKETDFQIFQQFIDKYPVFVKKEVFESCGKGIEKIDINTCKESAFELFDSLLGRGKTVLEECVVQHPSTAIFNESSVNTVRIITFNTKHGIQAPYTFMKIGRKGSFVDNGGAGGILVGIDEKTGVLNTRGIDELHREYDIHPDSGVRFESHQLPDWDIAISMCKEMAAMMPKVRYIGWDLAYTKDNKWVVIEGNGLSQFIGPQTIWQRGIKAEVQAMMQDMDLS